MRARSRELRCERRTDAAQSLDEHDPTLERIRAEDVAHARADAVEDAAGGVRARVARAAALLAAAEDVRAPLADDVHVRHGGVDVGARVERPARRGDEVAVPKEE